MRNNTDISFWKIAAGVFIGLWAFGITYTFVAYLYVAHLFGWWDFRLKTIEEAFSAPVAQAEDKRARQERARAETDRQREARLARYDTPQARRLSHLCVEWAKNANTTPTKTVLAEKDRTCGRYQRYIRTGSPEP